MTRFRRGRGRLIAHAHKHIAVVEFHELRLVAVVVARHFRHAPVVAAVVAIHGVGLEPAAGGAIVGAVVFLLHVSSDEDKHQASVFEREGSSRGGESAEPLAALRVFAFDSIELVGDIDRIVPGLAIVVAVNYDDALSALRSGVPKAAVVGA